MGRHPVGKAYALSYAGVGSYELYATSPPFAVEGGYVTPYGALPTQSFFYPEASGQLQGIAYPNEQPYIATAANPASTIYMPSDIRGAPHELVGPQCAVPGASVDSMADDNMTDWDYYSSDASIHLKLQSLPILESLVGLVFVARLSKDAFGVLLTRGLSLLSATQLIRFTG